MKHTVVIPLYNKEAYIYDTIRSLAFQDKKVSELIIVDDCSSDLSLVYLKDALSFFPLNFCRRMFRSSSWKRIKVRVMPEILELSWQPEI
ncbi:glycosyltransferase family A protein [Flavobacterium sp. N502540]|uniref:glycosyltransferase family A protein n=1 Tax=Flavobacterium sp. N502540 TaxID=2986838 RepID=UPI0039B5A187